ncbi:phosphatidate cytidylyltransferase [Arthrobacter halodurans]|uniref:Phosphatidate cytidylyltransferase n=1 Tax=Arthrobacter halodurans TaxID=516699 RepID=A0ABV4UQ27_9MICC
MTESTQPDGGSPARSLRQGAPKASRAGRNLPAAIAVGLILLSAVLLGLLLMPVAFVAIVTAFGVVGCWEVGRALGSTDIDVPLVPLLAGAVAMPFSAYYGGSEALGFALAGTVLLILLWRVIEGAAGALRSVMASTFVVLWVPLLLSFAILMFKEVDGAFKVATVLLLVVANDTFGYLVGAFFGKHPMAPKISPKKSWEGFAGSVAGATVVGVLATVFLLQQPWWVGIPLAMATVAAATVGDLSESMVKRELGIKDMSNLLPGHGGMMDRLDSVVFAVPVAYVLSVLLLPGAR